MPYVRGFLKVGRRNRPGHPDIGLPGEEGEVDPGYGIEEGGGGNIDNELPGIPDPPPGIWPPLTPEQPWRPIPGRPPHVGGGPARPPGLPPTVGGGPARPERPVDPGYGIDEESPEIGGGPVLPPGVVWPPLPPGVHGKYLALVLIGGGGHGAHYRYVVIDADKRPSRPVDPGYGIPDTPAPETPQPKKA